MWVMMIIMVIMMIASFVMMPKMPSNSANKMSPQEVKVPMATAGTPMQVPFGFMRIRNPNTLWYGGQRTEALKK